MLRITDVLTRNIILHAVELAQHTGSVNNVHSSLSTLLSCVKKCGITFNVWQKRDSNEKETGQYEFTSLRGNDKKKLLSLLPPMFCQFLKDDSTNVAQLWKASH